MQKTSELITASQPTSLDLFTLQWKSFCRMDEVVFIFFCDLWCASGAEKTASNRSNYIIDQMFHSTGDCCIVGQFTYLQYFRWVCAAGDVRYGCRYISEIRVFVVDDATRLNWRTSAHVCQFVALTSEHLLQRVDCLVGFRTTSWIKGNRIVPLHPDCSAMGRLLVTSVLWRVVRLPSEKTCVCDSDRCPEAEQDKRNSADAPCGTATECR